MTTLVSLALAHPCYFVYFDDGKALTLMIFDRMQLSRAPGGVLRARVWANAGG